ncbi:hypothetical protein EDB85DRAFT_1982428 [Lactarius pseudohatsudake]|nr:hypothetical protein EDB85DRAFT_1982428 [Lactarius pseudohatsudake]
MLINTSTSNLDPISEAEEALEKILDELQSAGILQQSNRMNIEELLNPVEERNYMIASDLDICDTVLMAMGNKGPDADVEDTDDEPPMPRPARSVTLEAVSTILRSIQDLDTPYARTVEEIMAVKPGWIVLGQGRPRLTTIFKTSANYSYKCGSN